MAKLIAAITNDPGYRESALFYKGMLPVAEKILDGDHSDAATRRAFQKAVEPGADPNLDLTDRGVYAFNLDEFPILTLLLRRSSDKKSVTFTFLRSAEVHKEITVPAKDLIKAFKKGHREMRGFVYLREQGVEFVGLGGLKALHNWIFSAIMLDDFMTRHPGRSLFEGFEKPVSRLS